MFALKLSILSIFLIIRYNQIVFQIYFPLSYTFSLLINDRDVNCCLIVYPSRIFAVCFLLVLKIIFVIEIIFLYFYCLLNFYIYLSVVLVNVHIASNYQIVLNQLLINSIIKIVFKVALYIIYLRSKTPKLHFLILY